MHGAGQTLACTMLRAAISGTIQSGRSSRDPTGRSGRSLLGSMMQPTPAREQRGARRGQAGPRMCSR